MKVPVPDEILPADRLGRVHFVGIGGAGLSGIARIMLARGIEVSGSDGIDSPTLAALRALGARVHLGHDAAQVARRATPSSSRPRSARTTPSTSRPCAAGSGCCRARRPSAAVMAGRRVVAVAGTHGKTTTTSLLTVALQVAGADPAYAIGGDLTATGVNAADGTGDVFVAEADESDGAFLHYAPYAAIVTNVEADHLDNWGTEEAYRAAFDEFVDTIDPDGFLVCCVDDPGAAALAERQRRGRPTGGRRVGRASPAPWPASRSGRPASTTWPTRSRRTPPVSSSGYDADALARGIASYTGTKRRMERKGEAGGRAGLRQLRPPPDRDRRRPAGRPCGRRARAGWSWRSSRTWSRAPGSSAPRWARRSAPPTRSSCCDVYLAREDADPEVTGALVAGAVPLPPERVAFVADLRRRRRRARRAGPARRPGADPRRRDASPRSGPRSWSCWPMPTDETRGRGPEPAAGSRAASGRGAGSPGATSSSSCSRWCSSSAPCGWSTSRPCCPCRASRSRASTS